MGGLTTTPLLDDRFELGDVLGRGGMGVVIAARHRATGLQVAVKCLKHAPTPARREQLEREIAWISALHHPHVLRVYDRGTVPAGVAAADGTALNAGSPYVVMQRAAPLGRPTSWRGVREVIDATLRALAHAHARGVLHLDVKPANLLRDASGGVRLADFGVARALSDDGRGARGTPGFMAPEQAGGGPVGPWTDGYAVAITAWVLLAGYSPLPALDARGLLALKRTWVLPDPPGAPPGLGAWLRRLADPRPEARFERMADALDQLPDADAVAVSAAAPGDDSATVDLGDTLDLPSALRRAGPAPAHATPAMPAAPPPDWRGAVEDRGVPLGLGLGLYGLRHLPLAGRERERDRLWAALQACRRDGRGGVVALAGAVGVGRRRLARWLAEAADASDAAVALQLGARPDNLLGWWRTPDGFAARHGASAGDAARALLDDALELPARVHAARAVLSAQARGRPVVLWLREPDAPLARGLARALAAHPGRLPILAVLHADKADGDALPAGVDRVAVAPLDPRSHAVLVRDTLGLAGELADAVEARTAGNPLFAVELVGDWVARGVLAPGRHGFERTGPAPDVPDGLAEVWRRRLEPFADRADDLERAAQLGHDVPLAAWSAVAGAPVEPLARALWERALVKLAPGRMTWAHPLVREVLRQDARRAGREAAQCLACAAVVDDPGRRGALWLRAGHAAKAVAPLGEACAQHVARGDILQAGRTAARLLDALDASGAPSDHPLRTRARRVRCSGLRHAGRLDEAFDLATSILADAVDPLERAMLQAERSACLQRWGRYDEALDAHAAAVDDAARAPSRSFELQARAGLAEALTQARGPAAARDAVAALRARAAASDHPTYVALADYLSSYGAPDPRDRLALLESASAALRAHPVFGGAVLNALGTALGAVGRHHDAWTTLEAAAERLDAAGNAGASVVRLNLIVELLLSDRHDEALRRSEAVLAELEALQRAPLVASLRVLRAQALAALGDWDRCDAELRAGLSGGPLATPQVAAALDAVAAGARASGHAPLADAAAAGATDLWQRGGA